MNDTPSPLSPDSSPSMDESTLQTDLNAVFQSILDDADRQDRQAALDAMNHEVMVASQDALDQVDPIAWSRAMGPWDRRRRGLLNSRVESGLGRFVFEESQMLLRHVRYWIERYEGMSCCADKAHWIVRRLARAEQSGQPLDLSVTDPARSYFKPTVLFTEPEQVLALARGLHRLTIIGDPSAYMQAVMTLMQVGEAHVLSRSTSASDTCSVPPTPMRGSHGS